ncbi:hypothetical protein RchiOBHm_Chr6g0300191 [Rosa chinensis]|uniref:Uncharacterized protein n=1 Tax=Rosa chinensis TaxID=74649 RepID=A0A2P6PYE5_ROSCH|nr:hypothetical protein RchiOBHm_Chr6g0300191 [Rosa chinensis]
MSSSSYKLSKTKSSVQNGVVSISRIDLSEKHDEETYDSNNVSTLLHLKPSHTSETLDKEVVLRRIRQRKRVDKLRAALQSLLTSPVLPSAHEKKKWVDDAFAAP